MEKEDQPTCHSARISVRQGEHRNLVPESTSSKVPINVFLGANANCCEGHQSTLSVCQCTQHLFKPVALVSSGSGARRRIAWWKRPKPSDGMRKPRSVLSRFYFFPAVTAVSACISTLPNHIKLHYHPILLDCIRSLPPNPHPHPSAHPSQTFASSVLPETLPAHFVPISLFPYPLIASPSPLPCPALRTLNSAPSPLSTDFGHWLPLSSCQLIT